MTTRAFRLPAPKATGNAELDQWIRDANKAFGDTLASYQTVASNYSMSDTDQFVDAYTAGVIVTCSNAAGVQGKKLGVKNSSSGDISVNGLVGQTIDSATTVVLSSFDALTVISDGANWKIY